MPPACLTHLVGEHTTEVARGAAQRLIGAAEHIERPDNVERLHASKADDDDAAWGAPRHAISMNQALDGVNDTYSTLSAIRFGGSVASVGSTDPVGGIVEERVR